MGSEDFPRVRDLEGLTRRQGNIRGIYHISGEYHRMSGICQVREHSLVSCSPLYLFALVPAKAAEAFLVSWILQFDYVISK